MTTANMASPCFAWNKHGLLFGFRSSGNMNPAGMYAATDSHFSSLGRLAFFFFSSGFFSAAAGASSAGFSAAAGASSVGFSSAGGASAAGAGVSVGVGFLFSSSMVNFGKRMKGFIGLIWKLKLL